MVHRVTSSSHVSGRSLVYGLAMLIAGCGGRTGEVSQVQSNLAWLGSKYGMFVSAHRGRAPKDLDELRKFVENTTTAEELARLKVSRVDELFTSPRDGKPFKMVSYAKLPGMTKGQPPPPPPAVLYEEVGLDGNRAVAYLGGNTRTVDEATLKTMLPAGSR